MKIQQLSHHKCEDARRWTGIILMPSQRNHAVSVVLGLKKAIWAPWKLLVANVQVWVSRRLFTVSVTLGEINHRKNSAGYYCNVSDFLPFSSFPGFFMNGGVGREGPLGSRHYTGSAAAEGGANTRSEHRRRHFRDCSSSM